MMVDKINIVHIITHFDLGGAERIVLNICEQKHDNIQFHLFEVVRGEGKFSEQFIKEMKQNGIIFHRAPKVSNKIGILLFPFRFQVLVLQIYPRIIHSHTEVPDLGLYLWSRCFGWVRPKIKIVRTIHNTKLWSDWKKIGHYVERYFKHKHANIAISRSVQDCYNLEYGEKAPIIYNGIGEVEQVAFEGLDASKKNILFCGRFEQQKGIGVLVKLVKKLANRNDLLFHIVGKGSLKDEIDSLRNQSNVRLYDRIYNIAGKMGSFDYVFMPSEFEGLALTSIEASFAKTPVIANRCPGLDETLPEDWPLFADDNDVNAYLKIFNGLNDLDREALSEKAYLYAKAHFSLKKMQQEYLNVYRQKIWQIP